MFSRLLLIHLCVSCGKQGKQISGCLTSRVLRPPHRISQRLVFIKQRLRVRTDAWKREFIIGRGSRPAHGAYVSVTHPLSRQTKTSENEEFNLH